jgi:hypothetical protein
MEYMHTSHYTHFDVFLARGCGRRNKAGVERGGAEPQVRPGFIAQAREAGDSHWRNLDDDAIANSKKPPPASRA